MLGAFESSDCTALGKSLILFAQSSYIFEYFLLNARVYNSFKGSSYAYAQHWYILFWVIAVLYFGFTIYLDTQHVHTELLEFDDDSIHFCSFDAPSYVIITFAIVSASQQILFTLLFTEPLKNLAKISKDTS